MDNWIGLLWLVVLLLINAFFVAAEFALVAARRSQIEPLALAGKRSAKTALWAMEHAALMLATCQLGITVVSLLILIALGAALWFGRPLLQQGSVPKAMAVGSAEQPAVVLYATSWCGYCKMTREFFAANGIRYTEQDIEQSSTALQQHKKLGGNGVPLIVVGDEVIKGWNEQALRQLLRPWMRS